MKFIPILLILVVLPLPTFGGPPQYSSSSQRAIESMQRHQIQQANERQRAVEAMQRYQIQKDNERQRAVEAMQRYQIQKENERQRAVEAMQRYQIQKDNERQRAVEAMQRQPIQRQYEWPHASEAGQPHYYQGEYSQPRISSVSPRPKSVASQSTPLEPNTVAINNVRVPKGATHYVVENGTVRYFSANGRPTSDAPATKTVTAPRAAPVPTLPPESFAPLYGNFGNQPEVGVYAYLQLLDEPIGPRSIDSPVVESPELDPVLAGEIDKDRFSAIKALFDNSTDPDLAKLQSNAGWTGRCVLRNAPKAEVSATLGFKGEGRDKKITLWISPSPNTAANAVAGIRSSLASPDRDWNALSHSPSEERPLSRDSLFFDGSSKALPGVSKLGYRLRTYLSPEEKTVLLVEGYSTIKDGTAIADKRVGYLEPVQYCYFTTAWRW